MKLFSNIEGLNMVGTKRIFIQELIIKTGQYRSSRFKMETALVVSPHSHGIKEVTGMSATTTRFSSISPAPANSPPNTLEQISSAGRIGVLHLVEVKGWNYQQYVIHLMERISVNHGQTSQDTRLEWRQMESPIS